MLYTAATTVPFSLGLEQESIYLCVLPTFWMAGEVHLKRMAAQAAVAAYAPCGMRVHLAPARQSVNSAKGSYGGVLLGAQRSIRALPVLGAKWEDGCWIHPTRSS